MTTYRRLLSPTANFGLPGVGVLRSNFLKAAKTQAAKMAAPRVQITSRAALRKGVASVVKKNYTTPEYGSLAALRQANNPMAGIAKKKRFGIF